MDLSSIFNRNKEQPKKKIGLSSIDWEVLEDSKTIRKKVRRVFKFEDFRRITKEMSEEGFREIRTSLEAEDAETAKKIEEIRSRMVYFPVENPVYEELLYNATILSMIFIKEYEEDNKC